MISVNTSTPGAGFTNDYPPCSLGRGAACLGQHAAENAGIIAKATATLADTKCKQDTAIGKKRKARDFTVIITDYERQKSTRM